MITLTRLNGKEFVSNCKLIETMEATPDTVISTVEGRVYVVRESVEDVVQKTVQYYGLIQTKASQMQLLNM